LAYKRQTNSFIPRENRKNRFGYIQFLFGTLVLIVALVTSNVLPALAYVQQICTPLSFFPNSTPSGWKSVGPHTIGGFFGFPRPHRNGTGDRIALVKPTFTGAAYNNAFYTWYHLTTDMMVKQGTGQVKGLQSQPVKYPGCLFQKVLWKLTGAKYGLKIIQVAMVPHLRLAYL
jgi:hypothetical protein